MVDHWHRGMGVRLCRLPNSTGAAMRPNVQSRIGNRGTCFRASLASILNLREADVPDFKAANQDPGVDKFLKPLGLRYEERPIDLNNRPTCYHIILGVSPRGGYHAVVGYKGNFIHDPHPVEDDPRRGLVKEKMWGELLPLDSEEARDSKAAEALRTRHDEIVSNHLRGAGSSAETAYNALYRPTVSLVRDAEVLLAKTRLDDDPAYWHRKLESAQDHLDEAVRLAKSGKYGQATSYLDAALTLAHMVIDKMRKTGSGRARDNGEYTLAEAKAEATRLRAQGKVVKILKHEFTNPRTGHVDTSYSCAEQPAHAKDAKESKYIDGPDSDGEYSAGASIDGDTAQRAGFKTYSEAADWVRTMLQKMRRQKATDSSSKRERLHRALDHVLDSAKRGRATDFVTNYAVESKKFQNEVEACKFAQKLSKDELRSVAVRYRDDMSSPWVNFLLYRNGKKES